MSVTRHEEGCYFCGNDATYSSWVVEYVDGKAQSVVHKVCDDCMHNDLLECYECSVYDKRSDPQEGWIIVNYFGIGHHVCPRCARRYTKICPYCGIVHYNRYRDICDDCMKHTFVCDKCGKTHYDIHDTHEGWVYIDDKWICESCVDNLPTCASCGSTHYNSYVVHTRGSVRCEYVCRDCYNNRDIVTTCYECGDAFWTDDMHYYENNDAWYCELCFDSIHRRENAIFCGYHSHKRNKPIFHGKAGHPKFGFELEMNGDIDMFVDISNIDGYKTHFYIEEDGSVNDGYEIISQPATLEYWKNSKELESVFRIINDYDGYADDSTGLHIHYNTASLDKNKQGETKLHEHKILLFVCKHQDMSGCVARRYADDSCVRNYSPYENIHRRINGATYSSEVRWVYQRACDNRYICVNLTNKYTIEFRIYKSTTDISELYAALEYTDAVVEYTRSKTMGEILADTKNDDFVSFIQRRDNRQKYEHLIDILTSESIIPKQPKRKPVTLKTSKKRSNKVCA